MLNVFMNDERSKWDEPWMDGRTDGAEKNREIKESIWVERLIVSWSVTSTNTQASTSIYLHLGQQSTKSHPEIMS
jgi:hypothetical protein